MKGSQARGLIVIGLITVSFFAFSLVDYVPKHSIYNESWNGTSHLRESLEDNGMTDISRLLISPISLPTIDTELLVMIGSERSFTTAEINAYNSFVSDGGTLILFEDFGPAQKIAESFGITFFSGTVKERNENITVNRPTQFFVRDLATQLIFGEQTSLSLLVSEAAGVFDLQGFAQQSTFPILASYPSAFIDKDNDNIVDQGDVQYDIGIPMGLFKEYNDGYVIVVGDASIPLNTYYEKQVEIGGQLYDVPNLLWSTFLIMTIANFVEADNIVFDESHQEVVLASTGGLLSVIFSTWVGILNSADTVLYIFITVVVFAIITNRNEFRKLLVKVSQSQPQDFRKQQRFISNPTLAERSISEQYILYNRMGKDFIHIAIKELYTKLKQTGKADEFLQMLNNQYGDLSKINKINKLLEVHQKMKSYIDNELIKWL